jgi:hypothetical protein
MTIEKAHQAIGAYFCTFSALDRELGETVKVIFHLQQHDAADTIVAALEDFARKARLVGAAVKVAKHADGSETAKAWKTTAQKTIDGILGCNDPDRRMLAHSFLEPNEDASVKLTPLRLARTVLQNEPDTWTEKNFKQKIDRLRDLTRQLQGIKNDLSKLEINMSGLGWMTVDAIQAQSPAVRRNRAAILRTQQQDNPRPFSSTEDWLAPQPTKSTPTNEDKLD